MVEYNHLDKWESNSYITTNQAIGDVVSTERHYDNIEECMLFPVSKGDKIFINVQGYNRARGVAILDDEYKLVYQSPAEELTNSNFDIEQDGFVIVNNRKSTFTTPKVLHYPFTQDNTDLGRVYTTHDNSTRNVGKGYIQDNNYQPGDFDVNEQMILLGKYGVTKIGNQLWTTENLDEDLGTIGVDEFYYGGRSMATYINADVSTYKSLSAEYQYILVNDWIDGHKSSNKVDEKATIPGKYIRVHFVATMNKAQLAPVTVTTRFASWNEDYTTISAQGIKDIGIIPAGETTKTFDVSYEVNDMNLEGIVRFDFLTTRSGTGIDGTTRIDFTDIKVFSNEEAYTFTPTEFAISVPQALSGEELAKSGGYGRLYKWSNLTTNLSKLGLNGWRLASKDDFDGLLALDSTGKKFRSPTFSDGTDVYGLNILGSGYCSITGYFGSIRSRFYGWVDTSSQTSDNSVFRITTTEASFVNGDKNNGCYSVRLVLDLPEDGSYPEGATSLIPKESYRPYNRNIGLGSKPYVTDTENGKVYVDDIRSKIYNIQHREILPPIPAMTLRFKFSNPDTNPTSIQNGGVWSKIESKDNIWDWTYTNTLWTNAFTSKLVSTLDPRIQLIDAGDTSRVTGFAQLFYNCDSLYSYCTIDVSGANTINGMFRACTNLEQTAWLDTKNIETFISMFYGCTKLKSVPTFDTSNATNISYMLRECTSLEEIPDFDLTHVWSMNYFAYGCTNVKSGALNLYNKAANSGGVIEHQYTFTNCGASTTTGLEELSQIPTSWGGRKSGASTQSLELEEG